MISDILSSFKFTIQSLSYLTKPWVLKYLLISGLVSTLVYVISIYSIYQFGDDLGDLLIAMLVNENTWQWVVTAVEWITRIILFVALIFVFKYVVLIITSPFMSALSEDIEARHSGIARSSQSIGFQIKSMVRGIGLASSNLMREISLVVLLLIIGLIPVVGIVSTILIFLVQAYYAGFGNIDFFMERRFRIRESRKFVSQNKGIAIGNGAVFLTLFIVPLLGAFFAPTICTISGTLSSLERT